jgi:hypothetical protein
MGPLPNCIDASEAIELEAPDEAEALEVIPMDETLSG